MMKTYEYLCNGEVRGPVDVEQLQHLLDTGQIAPDSAVRADGEWMHAQEVAGLRMPDPQVRSELAQSRPRSSSLIRGMAKLGFVTAVAVAAAVAMVLLVASQGLRERVAEPEVVPQEVKDLREALFKMRTDLNQGVTAEEYDDNLRTIRYKLDIAKAAANRGPTADKAIEQMTEAFRAYERGHELMEQLNQPKSLPEYAPVREIERKIEELEKRIEAKERWIDMSRQSGVGVSLEDLDERRGLLGEAFTLNLQRVGAYDDIADALSDAVSELVLQKHEAWAEADRHLSQIRF